jgi:hypothetical protein
MRDRVKPVTVRVPDLKSGIPNSGGNIPPTVVEGEHEKIGESSENAPVAPTSDVCEKNNYSHNGSDSEKGSDKRAATHVRLERRLLIQFLADEDFMKKYEEVRALLSQRVSDTSFENVFGVLIEEFLERSSPDRRKARRDRKSRKRKAQEKTAAVKLKNGSRHIPAAVRDEVYTRDKGRCTYLGRTGKRCGSTQALQIDHIEPFSRSGTSTASNLRLLCAKHNRLAAEEIMGRVYVRRRE